MEKVFPVRMGQKERDPLYRQTPIYKKLYSKDAVSEYIVSYSGPHAVGVIAMKESRSLS